MIILQIEIQFIGQFITLQLLQSQKVQLDAEQHEDINLITLLVGTSADGLQILNKNNEWIPVTSLPEKLLLMLEICSKDLLTTSCTVQITGL